ncbi:MAG TPA: PEP/pyruvate-binding domain-containing protein [bacterium]|nr:PEP/pyruvate-binding domain-containing protein [bacterium]
MKWYQNIFRNKKEESQAELKAVQQKFESFLSLLDNNNQTLKTIADMEEKAQGEYLFDINYINASLAAARSGVETVIECMVQLGGDEYAVLKERFQEIDADIARSLPGGHAIVRDDFTVPFSELDRKRAPSAGGKNAQIGEMRKIGLPAPDGFAVTAFAYQHFMDANDLQARISARLKSLDIKSYEELARASSEIRALVASSPVPDDLAAAIRSGYTALFKRSGNPRVAMRSSAIGEDTLLSFAGQYESFLNVQGDEIVERYRDVIASKFTPKAIYYFLSHELAESDLAMAVGCMTMIDAEASGVVYTHDPAGADGECMVVNSIFGLGKYLVDGSLTPDVFRVYRRGRGIKDAKPAAKPRRLAAGPERGTVDEAVPEADQSRASLDDERIKELAGYALKLGEHYDSPQDIEWALDRGGKLFLLQTRPLRVIKAQASRGAPDFPPDGVIIADGVTVCPGAGGGPVFHASSTHDLARVPEGAVLVAPHPFPGLITVMGKISALVTEVGGVASHMATIAREYRIPTLAGVMNASALPAGAPVTVCATDAKIYQGIREDVIRARKLDQRAMDDAPVIELLQGILKKVSPLNLLHPADESFRPENCRTFHDLTRFCHQRAMEEMFDKASSIRHKHRVGLRLQTEIPLQVNIIFIDKDPEEFGERQVLDQDEIDSPPMKHFWDGLRKEGWPKRAPVGDVGGFMAVMATNVAAGGKPDFSEQSFAVLSKEYMILSLRMGYHFMTIEAMCTDEPSKNYIRMQFKEGGSSVDRRIRRIRLITDVLKGAGFENVSKGDFLDTRLSYERPQVILDRLFLLGRMTILTKQLDMALSNDSIAQWYTDDIRKKLGLKDPGGPPS